MSHIDDDTPEILIWLWPITLLILAAVWLIIAWYTLGYRIINWLSES